MRTDHRQQPKLRVENHIEMDESASPGPSLARAKSCLEQKYISIPKLRSLLTSKRAEKVRIELDYGMRRVPLNCLMILHVTFAFGVGVGEARDAFKEYGMKELREVFESYAWVLDVMKQPHYHLIGNCGRDVASGFNWLRYERDRWINRELRGSEQLKALQDSAAEFGCESTNVTFLALTRRLIASAAACGVGRIAFAPVRNVARSAFYCSRAVNRAPTNGDKVRCYGFAGDWPRCISTETGLGRFTTLSPGWYRHREHLKAFCYANGFDSFEEADDVLSRVYSRKWQFKLRQAICRIFDIS
jgi:hypothetical protein